MTAFATSPAHLVSLLREAGERAWHLVKTDGDWRLHCWGREDIVLDECTAAFVRRIWGRGRRTGPKGVLPTSALLYRLLTRTERPVEQFTFGQQVQHEGGSYVVVGVVKGRARGYVRVVATADGGEALGGACACQARFRAHTCLRK